MAYNPNNGEVYTDRRGAIPAGHYSRRAAEYDDALMGPVPSIFEDPVVVAQLEAAEAAMELNSSIVRSPEEIARVEELSRLAGEMASDANLDLLTKRIVDIT